MDIEMDFGGRLISNYYQGVALASRIPHEQWLAHVHCCMTGHCLCFVLQPVPSRNNVVVVMTS